MTVIWLAYIWICISIMDQLFKLIDSVDKNNPWDILATIISMAFSLFAVAILGLFICQGAAGWLNGLES